MPPQPIETVLKDICPILSNAVLIGDEKKYLSVLLTLKCAFNPRSSQLTSELLPEIQNFIAKKLRPKREIRFVKDA